MAHKIFFIDEVKDDLKKIENKELSISKFVQQLNEQANRAFAENESFYWASALTEQPDDNNEVVVQYKNFECGKVVYTNDKKDWFINNIQCWLNHCEYKRKENDSSLSVIGFEIEVSKVNKQRLILIAIDENGKKYMVGADSYDCRYLVEYERAFDTKP